MSEQELSLANFRHGKGCVRCNGVGYSGRRGVFEVIEMTAALGEALQHGSPLEFERMARLQMGGHTLERNAIDLVLAGDTTIAEAMTVVMQGELR